ncbi:MAG: hypothetical protein AMXMBFR6_05070 [Betaproteobacteria bacterium]
MKILPAFHQGVLALEKIWMTVTAIALFLIMAIVFVDVGLRYFFNSPLAWSYDVISMYLMASLFFLSLSATLRENHHVRVDLIFRRVSKKTRHVLELIAYASTLVVMVGIFVQGYSRFIDSYRAGDVVAGAIPWPSWLSAVLIPLGVGLLILRLVFGIFSLLSAIASGADEALGITELSEDGEEI